MGNLKLKIGKAKNNDLVINNPFISDYHLELFVDANNSIFITDLRSENGTFVNGKRLIGFIEVKDGDEVFIGNGYFLDWKQIITDLKKESNKKNLNIKKTEKSNSVDSRSFLVKNLDVIVIYSLILAFIIYFFLML
jgi:pSer/pThr/pTyr-binding forkhead associated (FHA) protein